MDPSVNPSIDLERNHTRTIVIVGAGFCGTTIATDLLRRNLLARTRIVLIERSSEVGRGIAYAARSHSYLLNVPAERMSASTQAPYEFLEFARSRLPEVKPGDFLPRALYGEYLQWRLNAARRLALAQVAFEIWRGDVVAIDINDSWGHSRPPHRVVFADGRLIFAHDVVLAIGTTGKHNQFNSEALAHPRFIKDPSSADIRFHKGERVLIIGSGLTMADVVTASDAAGEADIQVISRRGLLPQPQSTVSAKSDEETARELRIAAAISLRQLTRAVRSLARERERVSRSWIEIITTLRAMAPALWQSMKAADRARFLRHLQVYWDTHRHRLPHPVHDRLSSLQERKCLQIQAGRIRNIEFRDDRFEVQWQPRGCNNLRMLRVDRVVDCSGNSGNVDTSSDRLWRSLRQSGLCIPDSNRIGIRTSCSSALLDAQGNPSSSLYYVGPLLRADYWEATGVQELRTQCEQLAQLIALREEPTGLRANHIRSFHGVTLGA